MTNANNANGWTASRKGPNSRNNKYSLPFYIRTFSCAWSDWIHSKLPKEWCKIALNGISLFFANLTFHKTGTKLPAFQINNSWFLARFYTVNTEEQNSYCAGHGAHVFFYCGKSQDQKKLDLHSKTSKNDSVILFKVHIVEKPTTSFARDIWHLCWNEQKESNKRRFHTI